MGYKGKIFKGCGLPIDEPNTFYYQRQKITEAVPLVNTLETLGTNLHNLPNICVTINGKGPVKGAGGFYCKCISEKCNDNSLHSTGSIHKNALVSQTMIFCLFMFLPGFTI